VILTVGNTSDSDVSLLIFEVLKYSKDH